MLLSTLSCRYGWRAVGVGMVGGLSPRPRDTPGSTTLPDLTIRQAQIIDVGDLCYLEHHTEQSASVTEM